MRCARVGRSSAASCRNLCRPLLHRWNCAAGGRLASSGPVRRVQLGEMWSAPGEAPRPGMLHRRAARGQRMRRRAIISDSERTIVFPSLPGRRPGGGGAVGTGGAVRPSRLGGMGPQAHLELQLLPPPPSDRRADCHSDTRVACYRVLHQCQAAITLNMRAAQESFLAVGLKKEAAHEAVRQAQAAIPPGLEDIVENLGTLATGTDPSQRAYYEPLCHKYRCPRRKNVFRKAASHN